MNLLMNFERRTTCRYMPHVVAYVVADVVLVPVLMSAGIPRCTHWSQ
jgi:hypothetical protein